MKKVTLYMKCILRYLHIKFVLFCSIYSKIQNFFLQIVYNYTQINGTKRFAQNRTILDIQYALNADIFHKIVILNTLPKRGQKFVDLIQ